MRKNILLAVLLFALSLTAQNLPHYQLVIPPAHLDSMNAHPRDEVYYPAVLKVDNFSYRVMVKYKGASSKSFPKKSWGIQFDNVNNVFGVTRINLHGDYKDYSSMRNFLLLKLFDHLGQPASQIKHVTFDVNDEYYGVYTQAEQINDEYLARNGRDPLSLYKANNHGAFMAPTLYDKYYGRVWEIEEGGDPSFNELRVFFNKCLYWSSEEFESNIANIVDVDNFLTFFAVHFVFVDLDNFTKNIFLNKNSFTLKYEFLPWDNEGSFGNSAFGVFDSTHVEYNMTHAFPAEYQVVFQRMLEHPKYRTQFQQKITRILADGFPYLDSLIDDTYLHIKEDVYADIQKEATNEDFDNSIPRLKWFMEQRKLFLQNTPLPAKDVLTDFYCSNPMPTPTNSEMTFRITSPAPQHVNMFFADSVNFKVFGEPFKFSRMQLYDDGLHDDLLPNDLVYGNTLDANDFVSNLIPIAITGAEQNYPPSGFYYIDYYGSKSYAINKGNVLSNIGDSLAIGRVFNYKDNSFVEVSNTSSTQSIDLSYCHLRSNNAAYDFMFTDDVVLAPNETIYVSSNSTLGNLFFTGRRSFYNLYYQLVEGDSLHVLSPLLSPILSAKMDNIEILQVDIPDLVINEIHYNSGSAKRSGDWVEIHNPTDADVDMTGWVLKDASNTHAFPFPSGYMLPANGYVVVAQDLLEFQQAWPTVTNVIGSFDFGLLNTGEAVRLFDNYGHINDSVRYSNTLPWPIAAAGHGATLELKNPAFDNSLWSSWGADRLRNGSPGVINFDGKLATLSPSNTDFILYPNPATDKVHIQQTTLGTRVELINLQGTLLKVLDVDVVGIATLDVSDVQTGVYVVKIYHNGKYEIHKLIVR